MWTPIPVLGDAMPPVSATPYRVPVAVCMRGAIGAKLLGLELNAAEREKGVPPFPVILETLSKFSPLFFRFWIEEPV